MIQEHFSRVEELFHAALENGEKGPEFLASACAGDATLEAEVADLLASYREWSAGIVAAPEASLPRFGPYECDGVLGSGGMGTVYRAHRADGQFSQEVAVKVLRGSLRNDWYRERFLAERQILAQLNHPHIARLLDGGMTGDGEPYLVMELVEGEPIDAYCDREFLSISERIRLFDQVLDAVDYAHRHTIVHRDLKPSNIFVTSAGQVKLLDFGTSKLLADEATLTVHGALTPRYASPEQLRGEPVAIASDVFTAGVVLYELLTGAGPFGTADSVVASLERAVGTMDPLAPEAVVTEEAARLRSSTAKALRTALAGDLASIVLKSLSNAPAARYPTAAGLREDLERYRAGRPVVAKQPTIWYRAQKFARRHRTGVGAAALALMLFAGAGIFSWRQARAARQQADRAEKINAFLVDMLNSPNPSWYNTLRTRGKDVTILEVLNELRGRIGAEAAGQPGVEIELRRTIGRMYSSLGQHEEAREELGIALKEQLALTGRDNPDTGRIHNYLAVENYLTLHYAEAADNARSAVAILNKAGRKEDRQALLEAYNVLSLAIYLTGEPAEVEFAMRKAIDLSREVNGVGGSTPVVIGALATYLLGQGRFDEATSLANESLAIYRARPGPPAAESMAAFRDLGRVCLERQDYACAVKDLTESLKISEDAWGPKSIYTIGARWSLALATGLSGQAGAAEVELKDCIRQYFILGGSAGIDIAAVNVSLGRVQMAEGKLAPAEESFRQGLEAYRQHARKGSLQTALIAGRLGECLLAERKREEALPLLTESYHTLLAALGPDHLWTRQAKERLDKAG